MKYVPPGYDIKFSSAQQAQQSIDFARLTLQQVAAGLGVPEHLLTGDLRNANYSSLRAALVSFRQRVEAIQYHCLIPQLCRPIWERFVMVAVLSGDVPGDGFDAECLRVEWYPPAQPWVDPLKDAQATVAMIEAGLMSRRQAVAALGYSVEELDAEIAADRAREQAMGLAFTSREAA